MGALLMQNWKVSCDCCLKLIYEATCSEKTLNSDLRVLEIIAFDNGAVVCRDCGRFVRVLLGSYSPKVVQNVVTVKEFI